MNKKVLTIIIGIMLLMLGAFSYVLLKPAKDSSGGATVNSSADSSSADTPTTAPTNEPGTYVDYSTQAVRDAGGIKLLFFHAPWCPQCREIEASIRKDGVPSGVTVFKVDYDSNQALRQQYGVTLQTTFVKIDGQGNKIASYVAYEEPRFSSVERELLR
ncbi:MAG: thioredoxin family protein [Candidatus Saccharimonas sp.]